MQKRTQALAEAVGGLLVVAGTGMWSIPAALILAGAALVLVGNLPNRSR